MQGVLYGPVSEDSPPGVKLCRIPAPAIMRGNEVDAETPCPRIGTEFARADCRRSDLECDRSVKTRIFMGAIDARAMASLPFPLKCNT